MSEEVKKLIKDHADRIRDNLSREGYMSTLYGEPLDMSDPDSVLVAAVAKALITGIKPMNFVGKYD